MKCAGEMRRWTSLSFLEDPGERLETPGNAGKHSAQE